MKVAAIDRFGGPEVISVHRLPVPVAGERRLYAEYVVVAEGQVAPVPLQLNLKNAGAMPITGLTALHGRISLIGVLSGAA